MTVQVYQENEYLSFSNVRWAQILYFARGHGWQPMGTVVDGDLHWKGGYDTNDGQFVLHEDGINFAGALEKGLSAIPEENKEEFKEVDKQIKELIVFSKKDGFSIY